jgi:hypothetical protein
MVNVWSIYMAGCLSLGSPCIPAGSWHADEWHADASDGWRHGDKLFRWKWQVESCRAWKWYTSAELEKCFHNRYILWIGGSTTRELAGITTDMLGLPWMQKVLLPCNLSQATVGGLCCCSSTDSAPVNGWLAECN